MQSRVFRIFVIVAIVLLAMGRPVAADETENERQRIVIEMFEVMGYNQMIEQIATNVAAAIGTQVKRKVPSISSEFLQKIEMIVREEFSAIRPEMMLFAGKFLTDNFSIPELEELLVQYRKPIFQKMMRLTPTMSQQMMSWIPTVVGKFQSRAVKRIQKLAQDQGINL